VRAIGAEGIVSKRAGSLYTGKATRDWRKTKCHATGQFIVTGSRNFRRLHRPNFQDGVHLARAGFSTDAYKHKT
jgi:hypothetical protein